MTVLHKPPGLSPERVRFASMEVLFNSVEMELARRWAHGEVPAMFADRPIDHLRKMVRPWWHLYHESTAAAQSRNRTVWERNPAYPANALDTAELIEALQTIDKHLDLGAISRFRTINQAEQYAVILLKLITDFYKGLPH